MFQLMNTYGVHSSRKPHAIWPNRNIGDEHSREHPITLYTRFLPTDNPQPVYNLTQNRAGKAPGARRPAASGIS